ncbi:MAG: hypothetical protein ABSF98_27020 [Bryobacteraceae bacterium]|jgi:hypothetical protein
MTLVPDIRASSLRSSRKILLLAPSLADVPASFCNVATSPERYSRLLAEAQRFRGRIYVEDGAVSPGELTPDGRHHQASDLQGWHILAVDDSTSVHGCARCICRTGKVPFSELAVGRSAIAMSDKWGNKVRRVMEDTLDEVIQDGHAFGELGGWAIAPQLRCTTEMMRIALSTWALVRLLGIHFLFSTATRRHCSASILRKLGGRPFVVDGTEIPHYYEPRYGCDMELLRFDDFDDPPPLFEPRVQEFQNWLATAPVLCGAPRPRENQRAFVESSLERELDLIAHA